MGGQGLNPNRGIGVYFVPPTSEWLRGPSYSERQNLNLSVELTLWSQD